MKDRLLELQAITRSSEEESRSEGDQTTEPGGQEEQQQAVVFEGEDVTDGIYREAKEIRRETELLRRDVERLKTQNTRFLTSIRRISAIKRDANVLGRDIQARAQEIYRNLERLGRQSKDLEERKGPTSAVARIARSQYSSLTRAFRQAMSEYNEAELMQREYCMGRIQRQAEIMGKELSMGQIDEMIESGSCSVFTGVVADTRTARSALSEIENRHKELLALEGRIKEIQEIFLQIAMLVEEQGCMVDNIEATVAATVDIIPEAETQLRRAVKYQRSNPCRKLCCCCFPCCK
ncbi:syntaxin-11a [Amphiprion ocellaris]|uniref:t-SNARE coiled-coil homology domain-containing protein n=1 Tax=Amphiprion ocellaris TaxID=80972 RepID=A0AAQ5Y8U4_AMPOC|nr:syntaxin-11a [Amphiprion ocellaris]XP_023141219.1 syntaxin-11a [Amphiprion ocellaris]